MQKYLKISFLVGTLWMLGAQEIFAQADALNDLRSSFNTYFGNVLQEKVYVHTDRSFYVAGDILWFKIYDVDARFNKPLDLSKVAYVEILNKDQKPVLQAKLSLENGSGSGSFFLPLTLNSGNYLLRAYSNWMKNFSPDFYFSKLITIVNPLKKLNENPPASVPTYDIHFFPEGGNLVSGLESRVGFRVVGEDGHGADFSGSVIDQDNDTVAAFRPAQFGIGHFAFTPVAGKKYHAVIRIGNNNAVVSDLPEVYPQGYVMHVEDADKDQVRVTVSTNLQTSPLVYFFVHTRENIKIAEMHTLSGGKTSFLVDKNKLGDGISVMTLFDMARQPVCERLYFKKPQSLTVYANSTQDIYKPRKKVSISLEVQDNGKPADADLSVSVYREDSLEQQQGDISGYIWLLSDLQANIESPGYYFSNAPGVDVATDDLMLTYGWRRFRWENILQHSKPVFEFMPEYEGHIITGKITDKKTGQPVDSISTFLSAPGIRFELGNAISDHKGQLVFDIKNFYGANEIVVQPGQQKDSIYRIDIMNPFSEKYADLKIPEFHLPDTLQDELLSRSVAMQVQNAYLTPELQKFMAPETTDSTEFYGTPDYKFFLDEYTRFTTMEEVMREYVTGVSLRKHQQKFHFRIFNDPYRVFFDDDPLILMDGVPVFDADKIIAMDPLKVKKIEVVTRKYFLGALANSGIVSYTTYKGDLEGFQLDPNALVLEYEGLQLQREFYAPVYETEQQINSRMPDFRDVLYWSPDIHTDALGKKQFDFYTSDQLGTYRVKIEGISSNGIPISRELSFEVNKQGK